MATVAPEAPPAPKAAVWQLTASIAPAWTRSVRPGDDFYGFANGTWAKNTPIPADKSNYGMFTVLQDLCQQRVRDIIDDQAKDDPNSRIGAAYASFIDEAAVEAKGLTPIAAVARARSAGSTSRLALCLAARPTPLATASLSSSIGGVSAGRPPQRCLHHRFGQAGLGMPDRDYYLLERPEARRDSGGLSSTI